MMSRPSLEFIFKLAGHLGKYAFQIMQEMPSWELTYWMAFDKIHPIPDHTWNAGLITAAIWNSKSREYKNEVEPTDFLPIGQAYRAKLENEKNQRRIQLENEQSRLRAQQMYQQALAKQRMLKPESGRFQCSATSIDDEGC